MCECSPQFEANTRLKKQLKIVLVLMIIGGLLSIAFFILQSFSMGFSILIALLFLFCGYQSLLYYYLSLYIFLTLFTSFLLFVSVGIVIQQELLNAQPLSETSQLVLFGFILFTLLYNIFSIIFIFPIYKEMRAQLYEMALGAGGQAGGDEENQNRVPMVNNQRSENAPSSNNNQRSGFQAFAGRGTALGGS